MLKSTLQTLKTDIKMDLNAVPFNSQEGPLNLIGPFSVKVNWTPPPPCAYILMVHFHIPLTSFNP